MEWEDKHGVSRETKIIEKDAFRHGPIEYFKGRTAFMNSGVIKRTGPPR